MTTPPRILIIGAHPDDCEYKAGGLTWLSRQRGATVRYVSVTDGSAGHQQLSGAQLAAIRRAEADAVMKLTGVEYDILPYPDGLLEPTLAARLHILKLIRSFRPDLVLTHRPNDYHPDHRVTAQLVCDAAYMVTVPAIAPDVPFLPENPVIGYLSDDFQRPYPLQPDILVDVTAVADQIVDQLACHASQFFEWLPFNRGVLDQVPTTETDRWEWLKEMALERHTRAAEKYRLQLIAQYGPSAAQSIRYVEAFEISEYGGALTPEKRQQLFPFVPS